MALKKGLHPRVELRDPSQAAKYLDMGVKHFCIGWDVRILADWWDTKGAEMSRHAGRQSPQRRPRRPRRPATTDVCERLMKPPIAPRTPVAAHPARRHGHG